MWTKKFQMYKQGLGKAEEPEVKLPASARSQKKQKNSRKTSTSVSLTVRKPLTVWIIANCGKLLKRWAYQTTWPAAWEMCMHTKKQVRTGHGMMDCFNLGKGVHQGYILSPCLFNLCAEYSCEMPGWMNSKLESRSPGEIATISDM